MNFGLVAVALLFSAQPSAGGTAPLTPGPGEHAARPAPQGADTAEAERSICRRITVSGTHRYRRVCMTASQWRAYDAQNDD